MGDLTHNDEKHFHHSAAVLKEHPKDRDTADVMIKMKICDLTLLLPQNEEKCFRKLKYSERHEEPSSSMDSMHVDRIFSVVGHTFPGVIETETISVELK